MFLRKYDKTWKCDPHGDTVFKRPECLAQVGSPIRIHGWGILMATRVERNYIIKYMKFELDSEK
jgi:hypothetical protein